MLEVLTLLIGLGVIAFSLVYAAGLILILAVIIAHFFKD